MNLLHMHRAHIYYGISEQPLGKLQSEFKHNFIPCVYRPLKDIRINLCLAIYYYYSLKCN